MNLRFEQIRPSEGAAYTLSKSKTSVFIAVLLLTITLLSAGLAYADTSSNDFQAETAQYGTRELTPGWTQCGTCEWRIEEGILTVRPLGNGDRGQLEDISPWIYHHDIIHATFAPGVTAKTLKHLFFGCIHLETVDLSMLDTSSVTNMENMFYDCSSLRTVDLSALDTSSVTSMDGLFMSCTLLQTANLSTIDTSSVINMHNMFYNCASLESVNLSGFDTSAVLNMKSMFSRCSSLRTLDLSSFDTSSVTSMESMFSMCTSLESVNLSSLETSSVTNMGYMFEDCSSLKHIDLSNIETSSVTNMYALFSGCSSLEAIDLSNFDTSSVLSMKLMFNRCCSLKDLDLGRLDTSAVTNMYGLFGGCSSLEIIDLSSFDTSSVVDMSWMFADCSSLREINLSSFDTSSVTMMQFMFAGCRSLQTLDLSSFNTFSTRIMNSMFQECTKLQTIDLSSFNTPALTNTNSMFRYCYSLQAIDLFAFDMSKVSSMGHMFEDCRNLTVIYVDDTYAPPLQNIREAAFSGCTKLVGGSGTPYVSQPEERAYGSYARIDDPENGRPGYFTLKGTPGLPIQPERFEAEVCFLPTVQGGAHVLQENYKVVWDDTWFAGGSTYYNSELAHTAIALSCAAYNCGPGSNSYIAKSLAALRFNEIDTTSYSGRTPGVDESDYKQSKDLVAYSFAIRYAPGTNGTKVPLIAVIVRGTPKNVEWLSNGNITSDESYNRTRHQGFEAASYELMSNLSAYMAEHELKNARFFVTGHSRGAAVANILAADLTNRYGTDNVFAYTFATPATTRSASAHQSLYNNIHNVINPADFVPSVPFKGWGFTRYGRSYALPCKNIEPSKWGKGFESQSGKYCSLTGIEAEKYGRDVAKGNKDVGYFTAASLANAPTVWAAYNVPHPAPYPRYMTFVDYFNYLLEYCAGDESKVSSLIAASVGPYGLVTGYFVNNYMLKSEAIYAHTQELYLTWLDVMREQGIRPLEEGEPCETGRAVFYCPVDIEVTDPQGQVVAKIVSDTVDESVAEKTSALVADVDEKTGAKTIWIPMKKGYSVNVAATDEGLLDITWSTITSDGTVLDQKAYTDLALVRDKAFMGQISDQTPSGDFDATFVLRDDSSSVIEPDFIKRSEETNRLNVTVTAEGEGSAIGVTSATEGDHVTVSAYPAEGWSFAGWYEDTNLVSTEERYTFRIEQSRSFIAKFVEDSSVIPIESIVMSEATKKVTVADDSFQLNATVSPEGADYDAIEWYSDKPSIVTVDQNGEVVVKRAGIVTIYAAAGGKTASCRVTVEPFSVKSTDGSVLQVSASTDSADIAQSLKSLQLEVLESDFSSDDRFSALFDGFDGAHVGQFDIHFIDADGNIVEWNHADDVLTVKISLDDVRFARTRDFRNHFIYYISDDLKEKTDMGATTSDSALTFETTHFSTYAIVVSTSNEKGSNDRVTAPTQPGDSRKPNDSSSEDQVEDFRGLDNSEFEEQQEVDSYGRQITWQEYIQNPETAHKVDGGTLLVRTGDLAHTGDRSSLTSAAFVAIALLSLAIALLYGKYQQVVRINSTVSLRPRPTKRCSTVRRVHPRRRK